MELLVVIAIIGVLVGLLLPAIQAARESSRRTKCVNNLRQIGLGLHQYHNAHESLPVGCTEWRIGSNTSQRQLAWSAFLLPYIEQSNLFEQLDLTQAFDNPINAQAAASELSIYLCPSAEPPVRTSTLDRGKSHYGGIYGERISGVPNNPPKGTMLIDKAVRFSHITDGTSTTLLVAEDTQFADGEWINGRNIFDQAFPINAAPPFENDIRSDHPQGANGLAADGSVHFLSEDTTDEVLAAICTRAGNEPIGGWE